MNNSSQQENLSSISTETYTITIDSSNNSMNTDTITLDNIIISGAGAQPTTFNWSSGISTVSINNDVISDSSFTFNFPEEWIDAFPDWSRVQDMCDKYPGLKIAFDNFQTVYQLVKDDYDNPTPKK